MKRRALVPGDRIKLNRRLMSGWIGLGVVVKQEGDLVTFRRKATVAELVLRSAYPSIECHCVRKECAVYGVKMAQLGNRVEA